MLGSVCRGALRLASPPGAGGRLSVLIFHRVLAEPDPLTPDEPSAAEFEQLMQLVKRMFNVIPLAHGITGLRNGRLPERALSVSFDDGYANNAAIAAPILARLGLPATFFVATGFLDGGCMFNDKVVEAVRGYRGDRLDLGGFGLGVHSTAGVEDRRQTVDALLAAIKYLPSPERAGCVERLLDAAGVPTPTALMMSSQQVHDLARAGFAVGGHTVTHPILATLSEEQARHEIATGKRRLEEITSARVDLFAYPNGRPSRDYVAGSIALVKEAGFAGAVTTSHGAARVGSDPFQVPRFTPWSRGASRFVLQLISNIAMARPAFVAP